MAVGWAVKANLCIQLLQQSVQEYNVCHRFRRTSGRPGKTADLMGREPFLTSRTVFLPEQQPETVADLGKTAGRLDKNVDFILYYAYKRR